MQLSEIAKALDCELRGDGTIEISGLAPIEEAGGGQLTFLANPRYRSHLRTTGAAAVIVGHDEPEVALPTLRARDPYFAFAHALRLFHPPEAHQRGIHPT